MTILNFIVDYWDVFATVAGAIHVVAIAIVNATKTPDPAHPLSFVYRPLEIAAGLVSKKAKE